MTARPGRTHRGRRNGATATAPSTRQDGRKESLPASISSPNASSSPLPVVRSNPSAMPRCRRSRRRCARTATSRPVRRSSAAVRRAAAVASAASLSSAVSRAARSNHWRAAFSVAALQRDQAEVVVRERRHGGRARDFLKCAFRAREVARAIGRDADVVVNRGPCIPSARPVRTGPRRGKNLWASNAVRASAKRAWASRGGVRAHADQQRIRRKTQRRAARRFNRPACGGRPGGAGGLRWLGWFRRLGFSLFWRASSERCFASSETC